MAQKTSQTYFLTDNPGGIVHGPAPIMRFMTSPTRWRSSGGLYRFQPMQNEITRGYFAERAQQEARAHSAERCAPGLPIPRMAQLPIQSKPILSRSVYPHSLRRHDAERRPR